MLLKLSVARVNGGEKSLFDLLCGHVAALKPKCGTDLPERVPAMSPTEKSVATLSLSTSSDDPHFVNVVVLVEATRSTYLST